MVSPRPYNISDPEDLKRWFREMKGYLMIKGSDGNFLHQGTDREGRQYAWEALLDLEKFFFNGGEWMGPLTSRIVRWFHGPVEQQILNTKQCETCRLAELRGCMYHGYPKDTIPPSCEYKIGIHAEGMQQAPIATQAAVETRKDALSLLEEWDDYNNRHFGIPHPLFGEMIRLVCEKPDEVRKYIESLRSSPSEQARDPK